MQCNYYHYCCRREDTIYSVNSWSYQRNDLLIYDRTGERASPAKHSTTPLNALADIYISIYIKVLSLYIPAIAYASTDTYTATQYIERQTLT